MMSVRADDRSTIFSNVLLSAPLMDQITSYQCGMYGGLRSLQRQARHYGPTLRRKLVDGDAILLDSLTMDFLPWCSSSRHILKASRVLTMFHPLLEYLVMYIGELSMLETVYENGGLQAAGRDYLRLALSLWHHPTWHVKQDQTVVLAFLEERGYDIHSEQALQRAMEGCASSGRLDAIQYLLRQHGDHDYSSRPMDLAAKNGQLEVVKYFHHYRLEGCTNFAMDFAAQSGHFSVVKFLHDHRREGCTTYAMDMAAANGHFEIVNFLHTHRTEGCTTYAIDYAAANGHLQVVEFLLHHRQEEHSSNAIKWAQERGHHDVLTLLETFEHPSTCMAHCTTL
ncbi:hypothetical protein AC1031_005928 [Aphanomyces cochlioides]|nr:hypothetical protein AC1031_005928 [Aphanomyces cochlioides]